MDYRKMYDDKEHLYAYDLDGLPGNERTLEIAGVARGELTGENNRKSKKPMVSFVGETKKLALNKTNGKTIAALYGKDADRWAGELITIYATTTDFGGKTVDCIRVRPQRPERTTSGKAQGQSGSRQSSKRGGSANAGQQLIAQYEACDSDAKLAELKTLRGQIWNRLDEPTREAIGAAAHAAKARIDAAAGRSAGATSSDTRPEDQDDDDEDEDDTSDPPVDEDEAAEIASQEQESARGG